MTRARGAALLAAALALVVAGCTAPVFQECTVQCGLNGACPLAYRATCGTDNYCHADDKVGQLCPGAGDGGSDLGDAAMTLSDLAGDGAGPIVDGGGGADGAVDGGVLDPFTSLALGDNHTCALRKSGALHCWGDDSRGQLGDGTQSSRNVTSPRIGTATWREISAGERFTCGVQSDTTLWCWGSNANGRLGSAGGDTSNPRQVILGVGPETGWSTVGAGAQHACAIQQGALYCWGNNGYGRLGDNSINDRSQPQLIAGFSDWTRVAGGIYHTCGLRGTGLLYCWGYNGNAQLGDNGAVAESRVPLAIGTFTDWIDLSSGAPWSCGRRADKLIYCWGENPYYYNFQPKVPTQLNSTLYRGVSVGYYHMCGLRDGVNTISCWGANGDGRIGDGTTSGAQTPTQVDSNPWQAVAAAGNGHTCGIRGGAVYCWGSNSDGQAGNGTTCDKQVPVNVAPGTQWLEVSANEAHTCGIQKDRTLWCWGDNNNSAVGAPSGLSIYTTPFKVAGANWQQLGVGGFHTCAVRDDNGTRNLYCWGYNGSGQLGTGDTTEVSDPTPSGLTLPSMVTGGAYHTCSVQTSGKIYCWGANQHGQLAYMGMPDGTDHVTPLQVGTATDWSWVTTRDVQTCAISPSGLWCWGSYLDKNDVGVPTSIDASPSWQTVSLGTYHLCGVWADHTIHCKGLNYSGQLGSSTDSDWATVTAGAFHTCGVRLASGGNASTLWCWGENGAGQLGLGHKTNRALASQVGTAKWSPMVSGGKGYTCGIQTDGSLWCWGENTLGQLGDGTSAVLSPTPTK